MESHMHKPSSATADLLLAPAALIALCVPLNLQAVMVGVAKVDITPGGPIRLCGYQARTKESEGVEQRLWARAMAIGDGSDLAVLITADIVGVPRRIVEQVAGRLEKQK